MDWSGFPSSPEPGECFLYRLSGPVWGVIMSERRKQYSIRCACVLPVFRRRMMHYGEGKYRTCISAPTPSPVAADVENHRSQSMPQLSLAISLKIASPFKIKSETLSKIEPRKEKSTHVKSLDFRHDRRPRRIRVDWFVSGKWFHHSSQTHPWSLWVRCYECQPGTSIFYF